MIDRSIIQAPVLYGRAFTAAVATLVLSPYKSQVETGDLHQRGGHQPCRSLKLSTELHKYSQVLAICHLSLHISSLNATRLVKCQSFLH